MKAKALAFAGPDLKLVCVSLWLLVPLVARSKFNAGIALYSHRMHLQSPDLGTQPHHIHVELLCDQYFGVSFNSGSVTALLL